MSKIIRNMIRCNTCGDTIESTSRHDFKYCKCGHVFVDGGHDYLRIGYTMAFSKPPYDAQILCT
jgi:hypothetical protein